MTPSDIEPSPAAGNTAGRPGSRPTEAREGRAAPARPSLSDKAAAPVLVKLPAPVSVRLSQLCWVLSVAVGAVGVVYLFVIRAPQLPEIVALIRGVDGTRADATYDAAADIVFWSVFGGAIAILLVQITLLVSFSNRRPNTRWWLLATVLLQGAVVFVCRELVAVGDRGMPLRGIMLLQLGLAVLALLFGVFRKALRWTARRHDVQGGLAGGSDNGGL